MATKSIIVFGNPVDGFQFVGPFEDTDDAIDWAENHAPDYDPWNTAPLEAPTAEDPFVDSTEADGALGQDHTT